ncbi:DUF1523 family protein [Brevirhabdus sp.]|uniref:DUF1523 family protein n=1 Tax=Brevirhabdus sp. TaxID=2004514 RepID=UPI00405895F8
MRYVKWGLLGLIAIIVGGFLHYTLPQVDIVRITDTEVRRVDFGRNSIFWAAADGGASAQINRDVRFINTKMADGSTMVYRNEDTGWGWPPYFKLDSSNLQTEAADLRSTAANPQWVAIRHYGWRNEWLSIYPNATKVWAVAGPDAGGINWLLWSILAVIVVGLLVVWRLSLNLWNRVAGAAFARHDRVGQTDGPVLPPKDAGAHGLRARWRRGTRR